MEKDNFNQRKQSILSKSDKSSIGEWDEKIKELCGKINSFEEYYTTSSCAGRIVLLKDKEGERGDLFLKVWHDLISFEELKEGLSEIIKSNVKFKQESPIFHVCCEDLEDAFKLLEKCRGIGFKRSGIISGKERRIIVEVLGTEKLEFPIIKDGEVLVSDEFLKVIVEKASLNLKKGWEKIEGLKKIL